MFVLALALSAIAQQDHDQWQSLDRDIAALVKSQEEQRDLRLYEISDLIDPTLIDFEPPELGVVKSPRTPVQAVPVDPNTEPPRPEPTREDRVRATEALAALIQRRVEPAFDPAFKKAVQVGDGSILIQATAKQHAWIADFFRAQREFKGVIRIDAKLLLVPLDALKRLGLESAAMINTPSDVDQLVARCAREPGYEALFAPSLMTYPRQRANMSMIKRLSYVADWEVQIVEPGAQEIADPTIGVINEGVVVDVRAAPAAEGKFVVELSIERCEVKRPLRTEKVRIGKAHPSEVELSLPEVDKQKLSSTVLLRDGASVVLTPGAVKSERVFVAIVTVSRAAN